MWEDIQNFLNNEKKQFLTFDYNYIKYETFCFAFSWIRTNGLYLSGFFTELGSTLVLLGLPETVGSNPAECNIFT